MACRGTWWESCKRMINNPAQNLWMTPQINDYYCGPACLQYAYKKLFDKEVFQEHIGLISRSTPNGTSHMGMKKAAEHFGFEVKEISDSPEEVIKYLDDNHIVIIGATWGDNAEHYSILLFADEEYVMINDQDYIPMMYIMRREDFDKAWHDTEYVRNWALVLSKKAPEYNPQNNGKGLPAKRRIKNASK